MTNAKSLNGNTQQAKPTVFDIDAVLESLILPEKISLLAGFDFWHTVGIPKKGIPSLRLSDGPNGVRGTLFTNGTPANCFPCALGIASAWDEEFASQIGHYLANEAKAKNVHVVLGPTLNTQRSPLGGRGFESFSEDPVLCGQVAGAYVKGMQANGAAATPKHFVCNDQEFERQSSDSVLPMRALREIYLEPFRIMQKIGNPRAYMTGYNRVNGLHVSENQFLLQQVLREEWGFDGAVMSDWTGVYSCDISIKAGLDLEMPGPPAFRGSQIMRQLACGKLAEYDLDVCVRNVLSLVKFALESGRGFDTSESSIDDAETKAFLRKASGEAVVLLKNDKKLLPIRQGQAKKIALIGRGAKYPAPSGGGSASLTSSYTVSPLEAISAAAEEQGSSVQWLLGAEAQLYVPLATPYLRGPSLKPQIKMEVWLRDNAPSRDWLSETAGLSPKSKPDYTKDDLKDAFLFLMEGEFLEMAIPDMWSRYTTTFVPDESGDWEISFGSAGSCNMFFDGKLIIENSTSWEAGELFFMMGSTEKRTVLKNLSKGQEYSIEIRGQFRVNVGPVPVPFGIRIGAGLIVDEQQRVHEAAALAASSDLAIVMVGLNGEFESEGMDRKDMELPGYQNALVEAVLAANPNTIVVNQSGMPVSMPWVDQTHTLLQAFYGGNEGGNGIADVLFGKINPSGRLPVSFPKRLLDVPASLGFGIETANPGRVIYNEGVHVGYRYYESFGVPVNFAFGHGLSYTTFEYSNLKLSKVSPEGGFEVTIDVKNVGGMAGKEVVQVYIKDLVSSSVRPAIELKGFTKLSLDPGQTKTATVKLDKHALKFFDEKRDWWVAEKGEFEVAVGPMLKDLKAKGTIRLEKTLIWKGDRD